MKQPPGIAGRDEYDALVVRTDYSDEAAWQAMVAELAQPWATRVSTTPRSIS
ncbi:DUF6924 domain-containing protein [Streptomyces werraensis]|uniref:DUF6924 domain-containing protein n=1 Tax=Streptomyces werraensis TaxID=68284 RepID=UPI0038118A35